MCNPPVNVASFFGPGGDNSLFDSSLSHHILMVLSGSGEGNPNPGGVNGITGVTLTGPNFNPTGYPIQGELLDSILTRSRILDHIMPHSPILVIHVLALCI